MARYYLTTPIYYVNDAPHIGHAYPTVIGDAVTRWHRLLGEEVHYLTGTDEHGLKVQQAAEKQGVPPREWADATVERYRDAWRLLDIANDDFIRTTEPRHYRGVEKLLQACYDAGDIELGTYEGLYCVACEAYYTEAELVDGNCPIHGTPVQQMKEDNYFFKLSRYGDRLLEWYEAHPEAVQPESRRNEVLGFIRQGLLDFSISRTSLKWGIPIPWDERHVTYVWFDALANYITAIGYGDDEVRFKTWWPGHHLIGKDILRFHCVYWPAMLLSAGLEPPTTIHVHGWLLIGGEKMSKTKLNQITPADLVADFGVDGYRYHFLADVPFGPDSDFSYEGMVARYNADLANNLGNLLSRVATVVGKQCRGIGPAPRPDSPLAHAAVLA
ncbi:MAG TPA: methionine--tRNA ligase, partial [Ilumatobacteraceae bacterium]|nr:methionine--tRNA ligase [Ilumatobacteraceae bacterium]